MPSAQVAELDESHPFQGLSSQQWKLCQAIFSGASNVDAYREVYGVGDMNVHTLRDRAWKAANEPLVRQKLASMRLEAEKENTLFRGLGREFVINGIMNLALTGDKDSVRLAAYTQLGKVVGIDLFRDVTLVQKAERTPEDVDRDLRAKLKELQSQLDGEAKDITPTAHDRRRKPKP